MNLTIHPNLTCLSGFVVPAEQIGFIQRGTHRLIGVNGQVLASLRSNTIDLNALVGRFVTVCGVSEGVIEGVLSLNVTVVPQSRGGFGAI